jgi:hypothetical protein
MMASIFSGLALIPLAETRQPSMFPLLTPNMHFRIQFEPCVAEVGECSFEVLDVVFFMLALYHDVIYIGRD